MDTLPASKTPIGINPTSANNNSSVLSMTTDAEASNSPPGRHHHAIDDERMTENPLVPESKEPEIDAIRKLKLASSLAIERERIMKVPKEKRIPRLPNEILLKIVQALSGPFGIEGDGRDHVDINTLKTLRFVNSTFLEFATEHVFDTIKLPSNSEDCTERMTQLLTSVNKLLDHTVVLKIPMQVIVPKAHLASAEVGNVLAADAKGWMLDVYEVFWKFMKRLSGTVKRMHLGELDFDSDGMKYLSLEPAFSFFEMVGNVLADLPEGFQLTYLGLNINRPRVTELLWQRDLMKTIESFHICLTTLNARGGSWTQSITTHAVETDMKWFTSEILPTATNLLSILIDANNCFILLHHRILLPTSFGQNLISLNLWAISNRGSALYKLLEASPNLVVLYLEFFSIYDEPKDEIRWKDIFEYLKNEKQSLYSFHASMLYYHNDLRALATTVWYADLIFQLRRKPLYTRYQEDVDALKALLEEMLVRNEVRGKHSQGTLVDIYRGRSLNSELFQAVNIG